MKWEQKDLKFYAENPRIYSILNNVSANPSQEEIEDTLTEMERDEAKITEQINNDIASKSVQDPASIKREAVFDNDKSLEDIFGKENLEEGIDLNKSFIIQKDGDEVSNDDQEMELE